LHNFTITVVDASLSVLGYRAVTDKTELASQSPNAVNPSIMPLVRSEDYFA
jgi:hypothetical protein